MLSLSDIVGLIGLFVTVAGVIISIILAKDGRDFLLGTRSRFVSFMKRVWSYSVFQLTFFLIINLIFLSSLVSLGYISTKTAIAIGGSFLLAELLIMSLFENLRNVTSKVDTELFKVTSSVKRLTEIEKIELGIIQEKWKDFLDEISASQSLIAIHNLVLMAEPVDINGSNIVAIIPDVLEPSFRNLETRFKELDPFLEKIYNKNYKLVIRTTKDYYTLISK
ncbi:MAG: hypothetical protein HZB59_14010 [Ignavibacteriales bacterium]|nr:hypothetical protein [Ignavibacteriales bacterium]